MYICLYIYIYIYIYNLIYITYIFITSMKIALYRYTYLRLTMRVPLSHCTSHTSNSPGSMLLSSEQLYLHRQYVNIL